jgi:hypothetical protein
MPAIGFCGTIADPVLVGVRMAGEAQRGPYWAGLPVIATVARLLSAPRDDSRPVTPAEGVTEARGRLGTGLTGG